MSNNVIQIRFSSKKLVLIWCGITLISLVLSEIDCLYNGMSGILSLLADYKGLITDSLFCGMFSALSLICSYLSYRYFQKKKASGKSFPIVWISISIFLQNLIISLLINVAYDRIYPLYAYKYLIDDIYDSCLLSSLCSLIVIVFLYERMIVVYERKMNLATIQLLQFQLNPHFIFNSLNILSGLIGPNGFCPWQGSSVKLSKDLHAAIEKERNIPHTSQT